MSKLVTGHWSLVTLRIGYSLIVIGLLPACSGIPAKTSVRYSAPNPAPVQESIDRAHSSVASAVTSANSAKTALDKKDYVAAGAMIVAVNRDLSGLSSEIQTANAAFSEYRKKAEAETVQHNKDLDDKNRAIDAASNATRKYHGLKFGICIAAAGFVALLIWQFRAVLVFIPPPYNFAAMAAAPIATFGFLWLRL